MALRWKHAKRRSRRREGRRFRASVPRAAVAEMLARQALTMTADNFKGSVEEDWRHDLYLDVWSTMRAAQQHPQPHGGTTRNDQSPLLKHRHST